MYYMAPLHHIELSLQQLSKSFKVILLTFPLGFLAVFYTLSDEVADSKNSYKEKIAFIVKQQKSAVDMVQIMKQIELYCGKNQIKILSHKEENRVLLLWVELAKKEFLNLIEFLEFFHPFSKIEFVQYDDNASLQKVQIRLQFSNYYVKQKYEITSQNSLVNEQLKLKAIVGEYILLNEKWYKNSFNEFKIVIKSANSVELVSQTKNIALKVYDETQ